MFLRLALCDAASDALHVSLRGLTRHPRLQLGDHGEGVVP